MLLSYIVLFFILGVIASLLGINSLAGTLVMASQYLGVILAIVIAVNFIISMLPRKRLNQKRI